MDAGFGFITAIPCFWMRLVSLQGKVTRTTGRKQREFSHKTACLRHAPAFNVSDLEGIRPCHRRHRQAGGFPFPTMSDRRRGWIGGMKARAPSRRQPDILLARGHFKL